MGKAADVHSRVTRVLRRRYGAGGLHLLGHLAAFAIAAYALAQIIDAGRAVNFVVWFGGAALLHDVVFLPLYSLLDRLAIHHAHATRSRAAVPVINHVRVPALISGLLLLVYFPLILGTATATYLGATGHRPEGYARNWALITVALFAASAIVYTLRKRRRRRR
jgi:ABC-type polysaccharide/polyol phosphate export permease